MLRANDKKAYKYYYEARYRSLYSPRDFGYWLFNPVATPFRDPTWRVALLGGEPFFYGPDTLQSRVAGARVAKNESASDANREARCQQVHDRFWRPWEYVLRAREDGFLVVSVYEAGGDALFSERQACAIDCAVDWHDLVSAPGVLPEIEILHRCAVFGQTSDWALYCFESCSALGGTPAFMAEYGHAAGGWPVLKKFFLEFVASEGDFVCNQKYKAGVEHTCESPIMAWN